MVATLKRSKKRPPIRRDVVAAIPLGKAELARALGISRQSLYDILGVKQPVSPTMPVRLGVFFVQTPQSWLNMQSAYDLWHAERAIDASTIVALRRTD